MIALARIAAPLLLLLSPLVARGEEVKVSGEVVYLERSGGNLYLELSVGGKSVGVELLPAAVKAAGARIAKGMLLGVRGTRRKGDKEIAYVVEVASAEALTFPGAPAARSPLVPLRLRPDPPPATEVVMIAGHGLWPPVEPAEVRRVVASARAEGTGVMLVDSGLTERWRAYRDPTPHYAVIAEAAREARRLGQPLAFYLPSFELRREKRDGGERLLACCKDWAQVTLAGAPFLKTRFAKSEFWNKRGDEALWVCPSSPWRQAFLQRAREAVKRGAETLFVDVPYFQAQTCRCRHCQERYRRAGLGEIPTRAAVGERGWERFLAFRRELLRDFFRELRAAIRAERASARLVVEESPTLEDDGTVRTGLEIGLVGDEVDGFAHEYSAGQMERAPFRKRERLALAAALALYRGLDGRRPTWVLSYAHDRAASRSSAAIHLAHDASFWETKGPEMTGTSVDRAWRKQLFSWFARHRSSFGAGHGLAEVALLYSPASRDRSPHHLRALLQASQVLIEAQVPLRVLSTRDLAELRHYRTLVLPAVAVLEAAQAAAIRASGVQVVATGAPPAGLSLRRVDPLELPRAVGAQPLRVSGGRVVVWLNQRRGEVQLRLANLDDRPATVDVELRIPGARGATALALLGEERKLAPAIAGDTLRLAKLRVDDLLLLRFPLPPR